MQPDCINIATYLSKDKKMPLKPADTAAMLNDCTLVINLARAYVRRQGHIRHHLLDESCYIQPKEFAELLIKVSELYIDANFITDCTDVKFVKQGPSRYCSLLSLSIAKPKEFNRLTKLMQDLHKSICVVA
jgi:hypothetical protein